MTRAATRSTRAPHVETITVELGERFDEIVIGPRVRDQVAPRLATLLAGSLQCDERETDCRSILNFRHALGHAIESLTEHKRYLHGEAVAIGMAFAAKLSHVRGYCTQETMQRIVQLLKRSKLSVEVSPELARPQSVLAMESDKKTSRGTVKCVCVEDLGRARFESLTGQEIAALAAR